MKVKGRLIIDATDTILGRLASFAAKKALEGYEVIIVNAEKAVITGNRKTVIKEYQEKRQRGNPYKGPFFPKRPDRILRRTIRGMLPWKTHRGRVAFKRVKVYIGIPKELEGKEIMKLPEEYTVKKLKIPKFIYLGELSKILGAKW